MAVWIMDQQTETRRPSALEPEAWALLGFIRRHTHGGPPAPAPTSPAFAEAYATLITHHVIERSANREIWVISDEGERLLVEYYVQLEKYGFRRSWTPDRRLTPVEALRLDVPESRALHHR